MIQNLFAVGLGGALGSIARYLLASCSLGTVVLFGFPAGTFAVNTIGSLLIGILMGVLKGGNPLSLLLITGFCGGFTTFSTFSADTLKLLRMGEMASASLYVVLSIVIALLATALGLWIGTIITKLTA